MPAAVRSATIDPISEVDMSLAAQAVGLVAIVFLSGTQQQRRTLTISHPSAPPTLAAMVRQADVIVTGQIVNREQRALGSGTDATPVIAHTVQITEVLKSHKSFRRGEPIEVVQSGGTVVTAGVEIYIDDQIFPVLKERQPYLMFLWYDNHFKHYTPMFGPAAVFSLADAEITIPAYATRVDVFSGKKKIPAAELLGLIRRHASGR